MNIIIFICFFIEVAYMTLLERKVMAAIQRRRGLINVVGMIFSLLSRWVIRFFKNFKQGILDGLRLPPNTKVISFDFFWTYNCCCLGRRNNSYS